MDSIEDVGNIVIVQVVTLGHSLDLFQRERYVDVLFNIFANKMYSFVVKKNIIIKINSVYICQCI